MCYCPTPTLHLNLALTGDGAFLLSPQKTHTVWFISILNYGDTENVLINHLLLVIPMLYPCHYTNLCPHKPHKYAHTHTHTHTPTHTHTHTHTASIWYNMDRHFKTLSHKTVQSQTTEFYGMIVLLLLLTMIIIQSVYTIIVQGKYSYGFK